MNEFYNLEIFIDVNIGGKMKTKKKILTFKISILMLFVIMILSCSKKCSTEPETDGYWNQYLFDDPYNNFVTNGLTIDNQFYCTGMNGIMMFHSFETNPTLKYISYISSGYDSKPIISKDFTAFFKEYSVMWDLCIGFSNYITEDGNVTSVWPSEFGNQFGNYGFSFMATRREFGAINNQNRFITTIAGFDSLGIRNNYIVYADFNCSDGIDISNTDYWEVPSMMNDYASIKSIKSFNDKFYLSFTREFSPTSHYLEISENGEIIDYSNHFQSSYYIVTFFEYQGFLCAHKSDTELIYTSDGENWQHMAYLEPYIFDFNEIDNYLFFYHNDKIYCLEDDINDLKLYQIPTENIEGRTISSINKFNDDLVITTSNGIYYQSFSKIMNDKELKRSMN